jgi:phenylalanyl-tRNA synthetase beta chain
LKVNELPEAPILFKSNNVNKYNEFYFINKIKELLTNNYFNECKTLNTTGESNLNKMNLFDIEAINIASASMDSRKFLRTNLLNSLLNVYSYNLKYKNNLEPIFEMQKIYSRTGKIYENVCLVTEEKIYLDRINNSSITFNCNGLIAIANEIGKIFNKTLSYKANTTKKEFYNNECLEICLNGEIIGFIGAIKNTVLENYAIGRKQIYAMTIN